MWKTGRNVQNVAGQQLHVDDGLKRVHMQQRRMRGKLAVLPARAHAPVAPPRALADEHVIQINVRPHATLGRGVRNHHIVQPPLRNERKWLDQRGHGLVALATLTPAAEAEAPEVAEEATAEASETTTETVAEAATDPTEDTPAADDAAQESED